MVVAHCKCQKLVDYLLDNGCKIVSNKYWQDYNIVVFEKDGETFPMIMEKVFYHFKVKSICNSIDIPVPDMQHEIYNVSSPILEESEEEE